MNRKVKIEAGFIKFCLTNLKGEIKFSDFISFDTELLPKTSDFQIADPRSCYDDIALLSQIHKTIEKATESFVEEEKYPCRYWMATLFHNYLSRNDLFQEGFHCRQAWAHLLKMRYYSMAALYRQREKLKKKFAEGEQREFLKAFRDWKNFCINDDNHFMFKGDYGLKAPEEEVKALVSGQEKSLKTPLSFFVKNDEGRQRLDFLIADWFLRDRYDWFGAFKLAWYRAQSQRWIFVIIISLFALLSIGSYWKKYSTNWLQVLLLLIYLSFFVVGFWAFFWRTVMDLFLPRVWAGALVGYLPLLMTPELWKIPYNNKWWCFNEYGRLTLNVVILLIVFFYLRWGQLGNRLARTPGLRKREPIVRAAWLTVYGWVVAAVLGLIILDIAGAPMVHASWQDKLPPSGIPVILGEVHLPVLLIFAPFALLIGVVVQIFWEEKPITHPA